jgi:hypothetical protein
MSNVNDQAGCGGFGRISRLAMVLLAAQITVLAVPSEREKEKNQAPAKPAAAAKGNPPAAQAPAGKGATPGAAQPQLAPGNNRAYPGAAQPGPGNIRAYPGAAQPAPGSNRAYPGAAQPQQAPGNNRGFPGAARPGGEPMGGGRPGGAPAYRTPGGAMVQVGPSGARRVEMVRPGGRVVVACSPGYGYVQRPFYSHGQPYYQRTYMIGGHPYARAYRPWAYGGREYPVYSRGYYYRPAYYQWAYTPWQRPYRYGWGWEARPWFGYYGGYFTPAPYYSSPAFWIADFMIATTLETAYLAQNNPAYAPPPPGYEPVPMSPWVRQAMADEVRREMDEAQAEQAAFQNGMPMSGPPPLFSSRGPKVFLVSTDMPGFVGYQQYPIFPGDVLQLAQPVYPGAEFAQVRVMASRASSVPPGSILMVKTLDLQEQVNNMQANMDLGLARLQTAQAGLPPAPAGALGGNNAPYAGDMGTDPAAANDLNMVIQDAN